MFFARMPASFIAKFAAVKPDPATGKPVAAVAKHFNETHPDGASQTMFLTEHNPPPSYANSAFYGIHTFKFNRIHFDPPGMADGILPTEDPILLFRSPSYAYSYARRQSEG